MLEIFIRLLLSFIAAIIAMLVHEVPKYYVSLTLLHPIYRKRNDTKLSMLRFIDPIGLILFMFTYIGWQKPGEYNPARFRDKERSLFYLAISGFAASIFMIVALLPLFIYTKSMLTFGYYIIPELLYKIILFSFSIIVINLLPIPPFNMAKIIYAFNPNFYFKLIQNERMIHAVFILLIAFNILRELILIMFDPLFRIMY